jgi:hypothetical protein
MFESGWLKKAVSLGVSLVVHAVMLVLLVVYYGPLKILDFDSDVRDVYIAPPLERLLLPDRTEPASGPSPNTGSDVSVMTQTAAAGAAVADDIPFREGISLPERIEVPPHLQERFDLRPPPDERADLPPYLSFRIAPERTLPRFEYGPDPGRVIPRVDLSKYIRPALPRFPAEPGSSSARGGEGEPTSAGSDTVSRQVEIARWADLAVAKIMERWLVPHLTIDQEEDEFEISVVIQRDGWIASTEVIKPARVPQLLAAALKALELSSPLPRLPRSFSKNRLEIRLVFSRK